MLFGLSIAGFIGRRRLAAEAVSPKRRIKGVVFGGIFILIITIIIIDYIIVFN